MAIAAYVLHFVILAAGVGAIEDAVNNGHRQRLATSSALHDFDTFVSNFARPYAHGSSEYAQRRALFEQRTQEIELHNAKPNRLWTAGVNHLTDRTDDEFAQLLGWRGSGRAAAGDSGGGSLLEMGFELASSVDWRTNLTSLAEVPDQGACGSCWAVTSAGLLEARYEIANQRHRSFSAQQLVDCVPNEKACGGEGGCQGATVELAMDYVLAKGLGTNDDVPYKGQDQKCADGSALLQRDPSDVSDAVRVRGGAGVGLLSYSTLESNKAAPLMKALMDGPVAISIAANDWSSYSSGVFDGCSSYVINHAVLAVGYGSDHSSNYYNIRNSWGSGWGENGFIRIFRGQTPADDDAHCGTDDNPKEGVACKPYPDSVKVCGMCGLLYDSVATVHGPSTSAHSSTLGNAEKSGTETGSIVGSIRVPLVRRTVSTGSKSVDDDAENTDSADSDDFTEGDDFADVDMD